MVEEVVVQEPVPLHFQGVVQGQFELGIVAPFRFEFCRHLVGHPVENIAQPDRNEVTLRLAAQVLGDPPVVGDDLEPGVVKVAGVFEKALENAMPVLEVKSRRVGGSTYQVPVEVPTRRRHSLAFRWIIGFARKRSGKSIKDRLAAELIDCYNNTGNTVKKREDTHRMAEAN